MQKMSFANTAAWSTILDVSKMHMEMIIGRLVMNINLKLIPNNTILLLYGFLQKETTSD